MNSLGWVGGLYLAIMPVAVLLIATILQGDGLLTPKTGGPRRANAGGLECFGAGYWSGDGLPIHTPRGFDSPQLHPIPAEAADLTLGR